MGQRVGEEELRRRAIAGVRDEVEAFGSGAADSRLIERDGLLASLAPDAPQRSLFNSVYYDDPAVLARELDTLAKLYDEHGVCAWTVWVPDEDRGTARLLAGRGHLLDAAPRAMAAALNDCAYGYGEDGFRAGLAGETAIRWHGAYAGEEAVGCVGTIAVGEDCCVTGVATPPEHRGRGIASWLMLCALAAAREEGLSSASLQATKSGAPIYERLGFADHGFIEMWELRR